MGILRQFYIHALPAPLKRYVRATYLFLTAAFFRLRYPGKTCQCNFCGYSAGRFYPSGYRQGVLNEKQVIGGGFRENARCPQCFSLNRERQILFVLQNRLPLSQDSVVLHVAPERNLNESVRAGITSHVHECDLTPRAYAWAKNITQQDLTNLTYDSESFDLVICNHVLEHIPNDREAMSEIFRVLRNGGHAILQIPYSESIASTEEDLSVTDPDEQLRLFGQRSHVRIYERNDYLRRAESVWSGQYVSGAQRICRGTMLRVGCERGRLSFRETQVMGVLRKSIVRVIVDDRLAERIVAQAIR